MDHEKNARLPYDDEDMGRMAEQSELPGPLQAYISRVFVVAAAFLIGAIAFAFYFKSLGPLALLLGTVYFVYQGVSVSRRWKLGFVRELPVICTNVKTSAVGNRTTVTFRTEPDGELGVEAEFFRFLNMPKKTADEFMPGHPYMIYYDVDNPQMLINFVDI